MRFSTVMRLVGRNTGIEVPAEATRQRRIAAVVERLGSAGPAGA